MLSLVGGRTAGSIGAGCGCILFDGRLRGHASHRPMFDGKGVARVVTSARGLFIGILLLCVFYVLTVI